MFVPTRNISFIKKLKGITFHFRRRVERQYIIIESDDWGLERAWSQEGLTWAEAAFGRENFSRWTTDSLETREDLEMLYTLLDSFRTQFGSPPVITANFIIKNVGRDSSGRLLFKPISSGFFSDTEDVRPLYRQGIDTGLICPQFHGYCHFIPNELQKFNASQEADEAYANRFFTVHNTLKGNLNVYHGELTIRNDCALEYLKAGMQEFENFFGFKSVSIIPPTYLLDKTVFKRFAVQGIRYLQAGNRLVQSNGRPYGYPPLRKTKGLFWGIRNARLDPHPDYNFNHDQCLVSINRAFENRLPAVIDFHRVNFAGRFATAYRDRTMNELRLLFEAIYKQWPGVNFITTPQLISILDGTSQPD